MLTAILGEPRARWTIAGHPRDPAVANMLGVGVETEAGEVITEDSAVTLSAFFRAVTLRSNTIGMTPIRVLRDRPKGGREPLRRHPLWRLLNFRPNSDMSAFTWGKFLQCCVDLWGNGFAEIERNNKGEPLALWPIHPSRIRMVRDPDLQLWYQVINNPLGQITITQDLIADRPAPPDSMIPARDMLHLKAYTKNGLIGYSIVQMMRESLGLTMAAETYGARFFGNGAKPQILLKHPARLGPEAAKNLRSSWREAYGGQNQHSVAIVEEGMEVERLGMPNEEAQFLETRTFQVQEISRWTGVPPHKLFELSHATFSNIEHQSMETVADCHLPSMTMWEQECEFKLLPART
jgi:HK97 family phage portal protein